MKQVGRPLIASEDFEDDGASFRVRQARRFTPVRPRGNAVTRELGGPRWSRWFFWLVIAPPLALAGVVAGAAAVLMLVG